MAIMAYTAPNRWVPAVDILQQAAVKAYNTGHTEAADGWFCLFRWASTFCEGEPPFVSQWFKNIQQARAVHGNMARSYNPPNASLGARLSASTEAWIVGDQKFSKEFFSVISPVDYLPEVFKILNDIHTANPALAERYGSLALAIAVVYDVPPAPGWPHAQVATADLVRKFPPAVEAFNWWAHQDLAGHTYHHLNRLPARELKFVIDAAAPFAELEWSQEIVNYPLSQFEKVYPMIHYRTDRATDSVPVWRDGPYTMPTILARGGICIDQAYFASEAGKARGIPTVLFFGAGRDGRHAWFGFLDGNDQWQYDAGRYAEQRLVTGNAIDPQTWTEISDHEMHFLNDPFRLLPTFAQSQVHEEFAREFLAGGDLVSAERAARKATSYEPRNLDAWNTRLTLAAQMQVSPAEREAMLREASLAFSRYPDLAQNFVRAICDSLRARGEASLAEVEQQNFIARNREDRSDLAFDQAQLALVTSMTRDDLNGQINAFNRIVDQYGHGAGAGFFDKVVVIFIEHLALVGQVQAARQEAQHAREVMGITEGTQLDQEMTQLVARIEGARS